MPKIKFIQRKTKDINDKYYILVVETNGQKIAFAVYSIK